MPYILTENNKELLNIIYRYGGYTRLKHLQLIYTGISHSVLYRTMNKLEEMKYLNSKRLKTSSKIESITYQVTFPTCKLFNNPNSYFRKKHQEEYIYRALIKSYFLCSIHNRLSSRILTDNDDKINHFKKGNFSYELFPRKYNGKDYFIHFEETVIDFTEHQGSSIQYKDTLLYDDSDKQSVIIFFDEYYKQPNKQVIKLVNRYINMIKQSGDFTINFLIVVDDDNREEMYKKFINKFITSHVKSDEISDTLLKYYRDILLKFKSVDDREEIINKYNSGELKKEIINHVSKIPFDKLDSYDKEIIDNINLKREQYIFEKIQNIIKVYENVTDSFTDIEYFFLKLFILEYNKYLNFGVNYTKRFDIKTYLIDDKIYQH
jgi:hypothetical protein